MTRTEYPGGTYVDALPSGEFATLVPSSHIQTHLGRIELPGDQPLYHRITNVGGFKIAGQAHQSPRTLEWIGGTWHDRPVACGVSPVIYDAAGVLHISDCSIGSQGWRYVDANGALVTGDQTYGSTFGIAEWSEYGGLKIGQGYDGGVCVWDGTTLRLLEAGNCRFIRVRGAGQAVAVSFWKVGASAVIYQATLNELRVLPIARPVAPPPEKPKKPPVVPPTPVPTKPEPSMSVNHLDIVQRVAQTTKPDGTLDGNFAFISAVRMAANDGAGFVKSAAGKENTIGYGDGFVRTSRLVYADGHMYKLIADAGPGGANRPQWADEGMDDPALFVKAAEVSPKTEPPPPEPQPGVDVAPDIARLNRQVAVLTARYDELKDLIANLRPTVDGARVALRTENGHYLCAEGGGGGSVNATRDAVGGWETFTLERQS